MRARAPGVAGRREAPSADHVDRRSRASREGRERPHTYHPLNAEFASSAFTTASGAIPNRMRAHRGRLGETLVVDGEGNGADALMARCAHKTIGLAAVRDDEFQRVRGSTLQRAPMRGASVAAAAWLGAVSEDDESRFPESSASALWVPGAAMTVAGRRSRASANRRKSRERARSDVTGSGFRWSIVTAERPWRRWLSTSTSPPRQSSDDLALSRAIPPSLGG